MTILRQNYSDYRIRDIDIPDSGSGFVYLLVSTINPQQRYIGQTKDLYNRLRQHNSGSGPTQATYFLPYALCAYVCGFDGNQRLCLQFEQEWRNEVFNLNMQGIMSVFRWARIAETIIDRISANDEFRNYELRFVMLFERDVEV